MLTLVGTITVYVRDQNHALAFSTQKLGFATRADMPMGPDQRWIEVTPPGAQTRILRYKPTPDAPGADSYDVAKAKIGMSTGMVAEADAIVAPFDDLNANGVPIIEDPKQQPWGWWGVFADQDGTSYDWRLAWAEHGRNSASSMLCFFNHVSRKWCHMCGESDRLNRAAVAYRAHTGLNKHS